MKKFISLSLILSLVFCFVGCSNNKSNNNNDTNLNEQTENSDLNEQLQTNLTEELVAEGEDFFFWGENEDGVYIDLFNPDYDEDGNVKKYTKIIVPETIDGKPVIAVGTKNFDSTVFASAPNVKEVVIPKTVKIIGRQAFYQAFELEKITGGEGITEIYDEAFQYCEKLNNPSFFDSGKIKTIKTRAFFSCKSLGGEIDFDGLEVIENHAFDLCTGGITLLGENGSVLENYYIENKTDCEDDGIKFVLK